MDADREAVPDDIDALKEALAVERAKAREITAELAVARAKASEDAALIAQQKLRIAKLERQIYGQRSERSSRLVEQLALTFEELEAAATEDELAAERACRRHDDCTWIYAHAWRTPDVPRASPARTGGDRSAASLRVLWQQSPAQTR